MSGGKGTGAELGRPAAMRILESLGSSGKPPDRHLDAINVGNETYLRILDREYLEGLLPAGGATFRIVQAGFGAGKTHFLYCVRERAWKRGYAVADVVLSARECPFDKSLSVYREVARLLAPPPEDEDGLPREGLPSLLEDLCLARIEAQGEEATRLWLREEVRRLPAADAAFREAVYRYMRAVADGDEEARHLLGAWLLGLDVPRSEHRALGIYSRIHEGNAFPMLRSMTQLIPRLGLRGTVILFDEGDRVMSLTASRSQRLMDNLRQIIDLCGQARFPSVMVLYAVPPEFLRNVVPDYPALHQRLSAVSPVSERSPQSPVLDLEHLDLPPKELLEEIAGRILKVFESARGVELDPRVQKENASRLAAIVTRHHYEVSHRRLFVKAWVDLCYGQVADGERILGEEVLRELSGTTASLLSAPEPPVFRDVDTEEEGGGDGEDPAESGDGEDASPLRLGEGLNLEDVDLDEEF